MAIPSLRGWTQYAGASGTSVVCAKPTGLAVGDFMVFYLATYVGTPTGVITPPSGFTLVASITDADHVYTKIADSADVAAADFTISWVDSAGLRRAVLGAFYADGVTVSLDSLTTTQNNGQEYNLITGSRTAYGSDCLALMMGNGLEQTSGNGFSSVTGGSLTWSFLNVQEGGTDKAAGMAYAADPGGSGSGAWTMATNASCTYRHVIAGVLVAGEAPPPPPEVIYVAGVPGDGTFGFEGSASGTSILPASLTPHAWGIVGYAEGSVRSSTIAGAASGSFGFRGRCRGGTGTPLPPTVWEWVTPEVDPEILQSLRVRLATRDGEYTVVDPHEISDLSVQLTRKGGVDSISMTLRRDARLELGDLDYATSLEVDYLGRTWQARLSEASLAYDSSSMTRPLMFLGEIARLREEHQAFRRCYVDKRLSAWKTDQGQQTGSENFEVYQNDGGDMGINVVVPIAGGD